MQVQRSISRPRLADLGLGVAAAVAVYVVGGIIVGLGTLVTPDGRPVLDVVVHLVLGVASYLLLALGVGGAPLRLAFACSVCGVVYAIGMTVEAHFGLKGTSWSGPWGVAYVVSFTAFPMVFGMVASCVCLVLYKLFRVIIRE